MTTPARLPPCPVCEKPASRPPANRAFPFCSDRCRMVDLGRWMAEDYVVETPLVAESEIAFLPLPSEDD